MNSYKPFEGTYFDHLGFLGSPNYQSQNSNLKVLLWFSYILQFVYAKISLFLFKWCFGLFLAWDGLSLSFLFLVQWLCVIMYKKKKLMPSLTMWDFVMNFDVVWLEFPPTLLMLENFNIVLINLALCPFQTLAQWSL